MRQILNSSFGISDKVINFCEEVRCAAAAQTKGIKDVVQYNQLKVLAAFKNNKISTHHLSGTTGYGYDDEGREAIDSVFAEVFQAEDAIVRHNIVSGTHAISTSLFAVLRPGDTLVSATGKPYDTLEQVIGISRQGKKGEGSLKDFGVNYKQAELSGGEVDYNNVMSTLDKNTKAVIIQKSKGYDWRPSFSNGKIGEIIKKVKSYNENIICIVDNCYGEFAEKDEPSKYGADLVAGSLIKNPGGGLAPTGGYIAGKQRLVSLAANRLSSVGLGRGVGATLDTNRHILQGLFTAPHTVGEALTTALFCGAVFKRLGFEVSPDINSPRYDIIQAIKLGTKEGVIKFCEAIQSASPVDSFAAPQPWEMPGYSHSVIMAAGGFVQGSSIELSADGPIKPPYIAYMQGGLTFESAYAAIALAVQKLADAGLAKIS